MTDASHESAESPVWARASAFPPAPQGWGWLDVKRQAHLCGSLDALATDVRDDRQVAILLVWTPDAACMCLPEEVAGLDAAMAVARDRWTREDLAAAVSKLWWFIILGAGFAAHAFYKGWGDVAKIAAPSGHLPDLGERVYLAAKSMLFSTTLGIAVLLFVLFGFIPWYQARKRRAEIGDWTAAGAAARVPALRFETWLELQPAPLTLVL